MGSISSEDDGYEQHSDRCGSYSGLSADISESESSNSLSFRRIDTDGAASSSIASSPLAFRPVVGNCSFPGPGALVYPVIGGRDVVVWDDKTTHKHEDTTDVVSEIELMKERFAKLLLGEDMSGGGKGVCTALAISNAITNLAASVFGELWRLEPMPQQRKKMWCREMEWLLCVSDSIVELVPSFQDFPGGGTYEVMATRPRSDLYVNLPALKKLDAMLLGMLDGFKETEFSYVERGITVADTGSLDPLIQSSTYGGDGVRPSVGDKWWLPTPKVPPNGGLSENARKKLQQCKDCTNQILKAAVAINSGVLAEMEVPSAYLESLPKRGKDCLGDVIYRYITAERFSPECLPNCLDLSSEHHTLEIANRIEAAVHVWKLKDQRRATNHTKSKRTSWGGKVKGLVADQEKNQVLAQRAETLLRSLKLRFPSLPQTMLDMTKIQYNKDVGQAILESYSRVIESLAFNITARIDDLLYADDVAKHSVSSSGESKDKSLFSRNGLGNIPIQKRLSPSPFSIQHSPYASPFATPKLCLSPVSRSPVRGSPHTTDKNTQKGSSDDPKGAKLNTLDFERVWSCPGNLSSRKAGDAPERD